jgi:hypothetical protein
VVRFLHHLESRERIRYVAMDMWTSYRDAVRAVIPQGEIVVDKFHVPLRKILSLTEYLQTVGRILPRYMKSLFAAIFAVFCYAAKLHYRGFRGNPKPVCFHSRKNSSKE